jgi:heat shock protein HtpX
MDDPSMNAFATGWNPKKSWIVFSKGILNRLEKDEIEAVAGHELTHILNGDVKNMVIINVFIGAIGTIGYFLMKMSSGSSSSSKK